MTTEEFGSRGGGVVSGEVPCTNPENGTFRRRPELVQPSPAKQLETPTYYVRLVRLVRTYVLLPHADAADADALHLDASYSGGCGRRLPHACFRRTGAQGAAWHHRQLGARGGVACTSSYSSSDDIVRAAPRSCGWRGFRHRLALLDHVGRCPPPRDVALPRIPTIVSWRGALASNVLMRRGLGRCSKGKSPQG